MWYINQQRVLVNMQRQKGWVQLANNLQYYREQAGMTRPQLAAAVGVDRTLIWRYEKGLCQPRDEIKIRIAKVLNRTVGEVFFSPSKDRLKRPSKP